MDAQIPRLVLLNYADELFKKAQSLNSRTAIEVGGFDRIVTCAPEDMDSRFRYRNRHILSAEHGNGFWLWKPYFVFHTLRNLRNDELLFYCDSGSYFVESIVPLGEILMAQDHDAIVFELTHREGCWTKRDAFVGLGCDTPKYFESKQRLGGFHLWRKTRNSLELAADWLKAACDPKFITDQRNVLGSPNLEGFQKHRHDQSLLSLLSKKAGLPAYRDPSQFGNPVKANYPNSPYPQLIELTRARGRLPFWHRIKRRLRS